jgi:hypothetical protein
VLILDRGAIQDVEAVDESTFLLSVTYLSAERSPLMLAVMSV